MNCCIKQALLRKQYNGILLNNGVDWCFSDSDFVKNLDKNKEREWGLQQLQTGVDKPTSQWTTKIGEKMVYDVLKVLNKNPRRANNPQKSMNGTRLCPDWETDDALYECKTRTYFTNGTAGEKILGTPWKYMECFDIYKKPLYIVCIGYQEQEAHEKFGLFEPQCNIKKQLLEFYNTKGQIQYLKFTELLKQLLN